MKLHYDTEAGETYFGSYIEQASALLDEVRSKMTVDEIRYLVWRAMRHGFSHGTEVTIESGGIGNPYLTHEQAAAMLEPEDRSR